MGGKLGIGMVVSATSQVCAYSMQHGNDALQCSSLVIIQNSTSTFVSPAATAFLHD